MKIRTLTLIIAAVMLIAVGVLVWPEPEEARAVVRYSVFLQNEGEVGQPGYTLKIQFMVNGQWGEELDMQDDGNGDYFRDRGTWAEQWRVRIVENVTLINPNVNPFQPSSTVNHFVWTISPAA
ncbi:MAG: hypothetical protein FJY67_11995 [Calditrichaeota bacterium]|nr:hypothetical protein [Calditrichota bacterium]